MELLKISSYTKSYLKVIKVLLSQFVSNHASCYTKTNLTLWAIRRPKGFMIRPHLAEKRGTLLF